MQGARGPFALVHGQLAVEVLRWLQQEVVQDELGFSFQREANNRRLEGGVKVEIAGHLVSRKREQASINGLDAGRPLPLSRVFAFTQAFKHVNQEALKHLTQMIQAKLRPLTAEVAACPSREAAHTDMHFLVPPTLALSLLSCGGGLCVLSVVLVYCMFVVRLLLFAVVHGCCLLVCMFVARLFAVVWLLVVVRAPGCGHLASQVLSKNGAELLTTPASSWAFNCGTVQAMASATRTDPRHFDGGASLLLAALTLFGNRKITFFPPGAAMESGTMRNRCHDILIAFRCVASCP